jgi:hypothetical protein
MAKKITAYKAFNADWTCRNFQYEVGKTYTHDGPVEMCESGFHACVHPLDVLNYYPAAGSRFALVEMLDATGGKAGDTKICGAEITIKAEIHIHEMVAAAVKHVFDAAKWVKKSTTTGYRGAASATGDSGAASATGYKGAASATGRRGAASATGDSGAASATGYSGAASATGVSGAASATGVSGAASATGVSGAASATGVSGAASATGYRGAASATGDSGAASATGYRGAASATGDSGAASATGYRGAASATGDSGAASATGYKGAASATGVSGAAMSSGYAGRVMGAEGCALFLVERNLSDVIVAVWAGIAGQDGIKPDVWYTLQNGKPVEVVG